MIFFAFVPEVIVEGQPNNCITLVRYGTACGNVSVNYTISGIGMTPPDDFTAGDFSIVFPNGTASLKIPIDLTDNNVCDSSRLIVVTITAIEKVPVPESDVKHFTVMDDDGEWTAWDTSEGPCNCETDMRERVRNRTCDNKGIEGRTCDGQALIVDMVSCAGDTACTTTTTQMPTPWTAWSAPWTAWSAPWTAWSAPWTAWSPPRRWGSPPRRWGSPPRRWWSAPWRWFRGWKGWSAPHPSTDPTNWSEWGPDGLCSATCDGIQREFRTRTCNSPGAALNETRSVPCSPPCPRGRG
ncbi:uncharacterized protein [Haliotis cracherodii]|uniref:uncharacterized protein n=1 Tax=Haliotis cracherodii TaxID=6455 RepID=UPI0039E82E4A